jgi:hypothetical protein
MDMSTARAINNRLDELLKVQSEMSRVMSEVDGRKKLINHETGEKVTKKDVIAYAEAEIIQIKNELNKLTNNGKNIRGIFDNDYYVNDLLQDKFN